MILLFALAIAAVAFCAGALASSSAANDSANEAGRRGGAPAYRLDALGPVQVTVGGPNMDDSVAMAYVRWGRKLRLTADIEEVVADIEEVVGCDGTPAGSLRTSFAVPLSELDGDVIEGSCADTDRVERADARTLPWSDERRVALDVLA